MAKDDFHQNVLFLNDKKYFQPPQQVHEYLSRCTKNDFGLSPVVHLAGNVKSLPSFFLFTPLNLQIYKGIADNGHK